MSAFVVWRSADRIRIEAHGSAIELSLEDADRLAAELVPIRAPRIWRDWTDAEIAELKRLHERGDTWLQISRALHRSIHSVKAMAARQHLPIRDQVMQEAAFARYKAQRAAS
jgi:hypothetical protein